MTKNSLFSSQGFSLIEALMAAAIVSIVAVGLGTGMSTLSKGREKTQLVSLTTGVESQLLVALQDISSYSEDVRNKMSANTAEISGFSITVPGSPDFTVRAGGTQFYTMNMQSCSEFSPTCVLRLTLSPLRRVGDDYKYAYSVDVNPDLVKMVGLGANKAGTGAMVPADFKLTVPKEIYKTEKSLTCDPETNIAMIGLSTDGTPICLGKPLPEDACPENSLAIGYQVKQGGNGNLRMALRCSAPMRRLGCPATAGPYNGGYTLQSFSPTALDTRSQGDAPGTCVFFPRTVSAASTPVQRANGVRITNACPDGYNITDVNCTSVSPGGTSVTCTTTGMVIQPRLPTRAISSVDQAMRQVTCAVEIPAQSYCQYSPAQVTTAWASARVSYRCSLNTSRIAERVPAVFQ